MNSLRELFLWIRCFLEKPFIWIVIFLGILLSKFLIIQAKWEAKLSRREFTFPEENWSLTRPEDW